MKWVLPKLSFLCKKPSLDNMSTAPLSRAIQESLMLSQGESIPEAAAGEPSPAPVVQPIAEAPPDDMDTQLRLALEMSAKEQVGPMAF